MSTEFSMYQDEDSDEVKQLPFKARMQKKLYLIFNEMMKDRNIKFYVAVVLVPLVFLQMIGYMYDAKIAFPFKDSLYPTVSNLLSYLRLIPAIESAQVDVAYWLVLYLIIALILVVFLLMMYVDYSIKIGKFVLEFPLKALIVLCILMYWVLLTPGIEGFIEIFICQDGNHAIVTSMQCWSPVHIIYCIVFTICMLAFILLLAIIAMYNNEGRAECLDVFRRTDTNLEVLLGAYRILIAIVSPFCRTSNLQWILIILYIIGGVMLTRNYFMYLPYHEESMSILYGTGVVSYLWVGINILLLKTLESINYSGQTVVIIIGLIVIYPLVSSLRDKIVYSKIFNCRHDKVKSEYELDIYMKKLNDMSSAQQLSEVDEMILLGYVTNHKSECANPDCPLNSSKEFYLPIVHKSISSAKATIKDPIILTHLLCSIYSEYSQRSNATATIHIIYSYFLFYKVGNIHNALVELSLASKCDNSMQQNFSIFRMKKIIEEYLSTAKKGEKQDKEIRNLDVNIVIVFEGMLQELQKSIEKSSTEHIEFWAHLDTLLPDLNHLHKLGLNIITYSKQTHDLWNKLCKINSSYPAALRMYGIYLRDIKNDEEIGTKLLDKEKAIRSTYASQENLNDFEMMFAESTAIIVISGAKETIGKITKTNAGVSKIFGYKQNELLGHEISIIMPPIIGSKHSKFLQRYFSTGKEIALNREKLTYAVDRVHYLVPICIIVKPISVADDDISYIALIRSTNKNLDYIITDNDGKIDSLTKRMTDHFGLTGNNSFFQDNEVYIHLIFPDLMTKIKLHSGEMITRFDAFTSGDSMKLTMFVPKDFIHAVQQLNKFEKDDGPTKDQTPTPDEKQDTKVKSQNYIRFEESLKFHSKNIDNTNLLKTFIEYKNSDYYEKVKINLIEEELGEGIVKIKIFKVTHENKAEQGLSQGSEAASETPETQNKSNDSPEKKDTKQVNDDSFMDDSLISSKDKTKDIVDIDDGMQGKSTEAKAAEKKKEDKENGIDIDIIEPILGGPKNEPPKEVEISEDHRQQVQKETNKDLMEVDDKFLSANIAKKGEKRKESNLNAEEMNKLKNKDADKKFTSDDVGSMISNTKEALKKIKQLRAAMYEKYEPSSVKQLKITSQVVFIILVALTLSFYFIQKNLMDSCQSSIQSVYNSKDRVNSITGIGYSTRMLSYMNYVDITKRANFGDIYYNNTRLNYTEWTFKNINKFATLLKESQNNLSTIQAIITSNLVKDINPSDVSIFFPKASNEIPQNVSIDCWSSIMSLVIHSHNVEKMSIIANFQNASNYPESVQYIMANSMNSILYSVNKSTDSILSQIHNSLSFNDSIFKILLSVASAALLVSIVILFPVAYKVARNKGHLLGLFMDINPKAVRDQLKKCRNSFSFIRMEGDKPQGDELEEDEEEKKEEKKEDVDPLVEDNKKRTHKHKNSKNYKKYNTRFYLIVIKFTLFVCFLEFYFLFAYFTSNVFFTQIANISNEVCLIAKRTYSNPLLFRSEIEMIGNQSSTYILLSNSQSFVKNYTETLIQQQEDFLRVHSENIQYNDANYNQIFDRIVYNSVCEAIYNNDTSCNKFMGGILQKGLHSSNVAFWDNMREIYNVYNASAPSTVNISKFLNDQQVIDNEFLESKYLSASYSALQQSLDDSIEAKFVNEKSMAMTVFLAYICVMVLVYYVYWRLFLESTRTSLSVTKSMLSIIPLEVVEHVRSINNFLKNTSITNLG